MHERALKRRHRFQTHTHTHTAHGTPAPENTRAVVSRVRWKVGGGPAPAARRCATHNFSMRKSLPRVCACQCVCVYVCERTTPTNTHTEPPNSSYMGVHIYTKFINLLCWTTCIKACYFSGKRAGNYNDSLTILRVCECVCVCVCAASHVVLLAGPEHTMKTLFRRCVCVCPAGWLAELGEKWAHSCVFLCFWWIG